MTKTIVIAVDPGVMTGYCYAQFDENHLEYFPFQRTDDVDDFYRRLIDFSPRYIIIENFEFRKGSKAGLNLFPMQLIGVARLFSLISSDTNCTCLLQTAATGKAYYSDLLLKNMGVYKRGIPHGMDASRHLLHWFTFGQGYQFNNGKKDFFKILDEWK